MLLSPYMFYRPDGSACFNKTRSFRCLLLYSYQATR